MGIFLASCKVASLKMCTDSHLRTNNEKTCDPCFIYIKIIKFFEILVALSAMGFRRCPLDTLAKE
jgi:hypothetical protein